MTIFNKNNLLAKKQKISPLQDDGTFEIAKSLAGQQIQPLGDKLKNPILEQSQQPPLSVIRNVGTPIQSDTDRVNIIRQGIKQTGQLPVSAALTGPRPVRITNQQPTAPRNDVPVAANDNDVAEPTEEEMINNVIKDMLGANKDRTDARSALEKDLQVAKSENVASARSRMGLGGMGLTGAAGALEGQEARKGERMKASALDEFDMAGRAEDRARAALGMDIYGIRQGEGRAVSAEERARAAEGRAVTAEERERQAFDAAMILAEEEAGVDLNGDGVVGKKKSQAQLDKEAADAAKAGQAAQAARNAQASAAERAAKNDPSAPFNLSTVPMSHDRSTPEGQEMRRIYTGKRMYEFNTDAGFQSFGKPISQTNTHWIWLKDGRYYYGPKDKSTYGKSPWPDLDYVKGSN